MTDKTKADGSDEIDVIDLFVIILKHRFLLILVSLSITLFLFVGYFFIPEWNFTHTDPLKYTKGQMTISIQPFIAQYLISDDEVLYSNDQNDLLVNNYLYNLFSNDNFIVKNIKDSGNLFLLMEDDLFPTNNDADYPLIVNAHIKDLSARVTKNISIHNKNWVYQIERKPYSIDIVVSFRMLDQIQVNDFLLTLQENANSSILGLIRPLALERVRNYKDYYEIEEFNSLPDGVLYDYLSAQGIIQGDIVPLVVVVNEPIIGYNQQTITDYKERYVERSFIIIIAVFFLSIFLVFLIECFHNLKNDKERYDKIRYVLRKK